MIKINFFKSKKGQLFSIDGFVAIVIFLVIFVFLISVWNLYSIKLSQNVASEELHLLAFQTTDLLLKTNGVPENWELVEGNVSVVGLNAYPGVLNANKVNTFLAMDYDLAKAYFNLERFDFSFKFLTLGGSVVSSLGIEPNEKTEEVVSIVSFAKLENEVRKIEFMLWRE
ncbi:MAG: hypothetical protein KKH52_03885 [Nanoarchaeota archaeon]|nr:hypothetical protein [Nanoarchaeota archaeon]MBU1622544.1 hypothetical protein [Nanoarchaeota archaeon]MBU1974509.1 hypothetical protein [Nanoarchaeota archaeon]